VAAAFLRTRGYRVLYRNFRTERGEIDLICRHGRMLVFVEVRTRDRTDFGRPAESIDTRKQEALRYAAERYLAQLDRETIYHRFDAVEVLLVEGEKPDCFLIENLFS
jgi:putative endonuclease